MLSPIVTTVIVSEGRAALEIKDSPWSLVTVTM